MFFIFVALTLNHAANTLLFNISGESENLFGCLVMSNLSAASLCTCSVQPVKFTSIALSVPVYYCRRWTKSQAVTTAAHELDAFLKIITMQIHKWLLCNHQGPSETNASTFTLTGLQHGFWVFLITDKLNEQKAAQKISQNIRTACLLSYGSKTISWCILGSGVPQVSNAPSHMTSMKTEQTAFFHRSMISSAVHVTIDGFWRCSDRSSSLHTLVLVNVTQTLVSIFHEPWWRDNQHLLHLSWAERGGWSVHVR